MKCPYRKTIMPLYQFGLEGTEEGFAECYGTECPFYEPEKQLLGNLVTSEYCLRAEKEK